MKLLIKLKYINLQMNGKDWELDKYEFGEIKTREKQAD